MRVGPNSRMNRSTRYKRYCPWRSIALGTNIDAILLPRDLPMSFYPNIPSRTKIRSHVTTVHSLPFAT